MLPLPIVRSAGKWIGIWGCMFVVVRMAVEQITGTGSTTGPAWWVVGVTGGLALLVSLSSFAGMLTGRRAALSRANLLGTIVHEAGHAAVSVATGGGVLRLRIVSCGSGYVHSWSTSRLSSIVTSAAGYAMPPLAGLGAAALLHRGHPGAVLIITVVLMALLLPVCRDLLTLAAVAGIGLAAFGGVRWGSVSLQEFIAYTEAWLLLTSEIVGLAYIAIIRIIDNAPREDDAANLAARTHVPGVVWIVGWFGVLGWGLWEAVPLLLA